VGIHINHTGSVVQGLHPMATGGHFSGMGVKRPRREANHSAPTGAEINETWIYKHLTLFVIVAYC
jgi:hypothetical protein